jgi:outer membrane protein TolC
MLKFNRLLLAALMTGLVSMASANFIAVETERVNPLRLQLDAYTNQLLGVVEDQQGLVPIQVLQIELGKIIRSVPAIEQLIAAEERLKAQLQNAESGYFPQVSVNVGKGYRDNKTDSDGDVESLTLSL